MQPLMKLRSFVPEGIMKIDKRRQASLLAIIEKAPDPADIQKLVRQYRDTMADELEELRKGGTLHNGMTLEQIITELRQGNI